MSLTVFTTEGPEKVTREGGVWEPIKIPQRNLTYIPNQTRCVSLLTRSRPRSYRKATSPWNRVRDSNHSGRQNSIHEKSRAKHNDRN
jgi:hypothetical protein